METQEKLFGNKPTGKLGETHIPEFSDIPRSEKINAFQPDGHGNPAVIKILRGKTSPERRRLIDQIRGDDIKLEKHIAGCAHCRQIAEHPEADPELPLLQ